MQHHDLCFIAIILFLPFVANMTAAESLPLWNGLAPVSSGVGEQTVSAPALLIHQPEHPDGRALVICPGGGYGIKMIGPEGHGIAEWLGKHGITGAVLDYRLPAGRREVPLRDAQQAIRLLRQRGFAHVGIIGFSAGGHLAALAATHGSLDLADELTCRPDFAILVYPVTTLCLDLPRSSTCRNLLGPDATDADRAAWSPDRLAGPDSSPCYLVHAIDDGMVPIEQSRLLLASLRRANVAAELLELPNGGHGLNGYTGSSWDAWQAGSLAWLDRNFPVKETR